MDGRPLLPFLDEPSHAEEDAFVRDGSCRLKVDGVCELLESLCACISVSSFYLAVVAYSCCRALLALSSRHSPISAMMRASSSSAKQVPPPPVTSGEDPLARYEHRLLLDRMPTGVELCRYFKIPSQGPRTPQVGRHAGGHHQGNVSSCRERSPRQRECLLRPVLGLPHSHRVLSQGSAGGEDGDGRPQNAGQRAAA